MTKQNLFIFLLQLYKSSGSPKDSQIFLLCINQKFSDGFVIMQK